LAVAATLCVVAPATAESGAPQVTQSTRIVTGIPSAELLLEDLSWIIGKLAGEQETWDDTLQPAAEVFLIGVDPSRPVGTDIVLDREGGQRKQFNIPYSNLQEFREENLAPIDIESRRRAPDFFELTSESLNYSGWMRTTDNYASISTQQSDVPSGMPSPKLALDALFGSTGYDAALAARNSASGITDRRAAFEEFRENMLAGISRRPSETPEAFELRKRLAHHQTERLQRLFIEAEELLAGWTTDAAKEEARGELKLSALAGTELAGVIENYGQAASYFAAVPTTDDALVHGRMNIHIDATLQTQADQFYTLVAPVWGQQIDGNDEATAEQKTARHKIADVGLAMLKDGRELKTLDGCIEITPSAGGKHILLAGIRTADGTKAIELIQQLPQALGNLTLELDVDSAEGFAIHRLKPTADKVPDALKTFYGSECEVYVATGSEAVWVAAGSGGLDKLKTTIALVKNAKSEPTGDVFIGQVRLGPMIQHLDELAVEIGFSPQKFLGRTPGETSSDESGSGDRRPGQALLNLDLKGIALPALLEGDDRFSLHVRQEQGVIQGNVKVERGVLKAAGKVIAKVAAERLDG
jgi:hypothetical protein